MLDQASIKLISLGAWALAVVFGSAGVFMIWASFHYPPCWTDAVLYLGLATGLEVFRPKT